jgi:hypothetical protein
MSFMQLIAYAAQPTVSHDEIETLLANIQNMRPRTPDIDEIYTY